MGSKNDEVGAYIEACPPRQREALTVLRDLVHESAPDAVETIRYKMPTFEHPSGGFVCSMASRKGYVSLYLGPSVVEEHREELGALHAGRGCVRFKNLADLPLRTIGRILEGGSTP